MNFEGLCRNYLELEEVNGLPRAAMPELPAPRHYSVPRGGAARGHGARAPRPGPTRPSATCACAWRTPSALRVYVLDQPAQPRRRRLPPSRHRRLGPAHRAIDPAHALQPGPRPGPPARQPRRGHGGHERRSQRKSPAEAFAASFAAALLLPARGLRESFGAVHNEANEVSDIALLYLARAFGVSCAALRARLEALRLSPRHAAAHRRGHPGGRDRGRRRRASPRRSCPTSRAGRCCPSTTCSWPCGPTARS